MGGEDSQAVTMESMLGGETIKTRGNSRCSDNLSLWRMRKAYLVLVQEIKE